MNLIEIKNINFVYRNSAGSPVLKNVSLDVSAGEFIGIQGKSGSGKSTLFHILGGLLKPTDGSVKFLGKEITKLSQDEVTLFRNQNVGFIFQQFFLLPRTTVLQNVLLPAQYPFERGITPKQIEKAKQLLARVDLSHRLNHLPNQLSGGEQQRVVIARALMNDCSILLADEPTGNLDTKNAENILELLKSLNREGKTVLIITHDPDVADLCPTLYQMQDGELTLIRRKVVDRPVGAKAETKSASPALGTLFAGARAVLPLAVENIFRNRMRAFLTMIGVSVGIAAVYAMLSFGQFAKEKVAKGYEELGANTVMIHGWPNWQRKAIDYTQLSFWGFQWEKDLTHLKKIFPEIAALTPMQNQQGITAAYNGRSIPRDVRVWGVSDALFPMVNRQLLMGKPFNYYNTQKSDPVCVIGSEVKDRLFPEGNPLGKIIFFSTEQKSFPCKVLGVAAPMTTNQEWRHPNLEVYVPFTYFQKNSNPWEQYIHTFLVKIRSGADAEKLSHAIKSVFEHKYGAAGRFIGDSDLLLVQQMKKAVFLFSLLLGTIAAVTLMVGGIGINNMMLVSIAERFREIGLRKALGATHRSIRTQFLMESILLCVTAGLVGIVAGFATYQLVIFGASKMVSKITFEWVFPIYPLVVSVVSILVVGIISGIVPAIKAEKLEVIEALRNE